MRAQLLLAAFVFPIHAPAAFVGPPPNIVFLLADDLGWGDLSCYGSDLHESPNIDGLANHGVRFTQAYAMSVCSPTRAAIMSGKHAARLHMTIWREGSVEREERMARAKQRLLPPRTVHDLPLEEITVAEALKGKGYLTFHVGKWHLGDSAHYPEAQGFDVNIGGTHWGAPNTFFWPFNGTNTFRDFRYVPGLGLGGPGDYLTDRLTDKAMECIDAAGDRPFFLNLWFHNPHTPIEGKPDLVERYRKKIQPGLRHANAEYAAMVHCLDENVGRILARIRARGIEKRTLVIFTSDNGGYTGKFRGAQVTDNAPMRSGKGSLYEGGIRIPLIARLPGVTPEGATCAAPVICMDFFPTFAELVGAPTPASLDGVSLMPLLRNPASPRGDRTLFFHYPHYYATTTPVGAIRSGPWKLIEYFEDGRAELYNLDDDPSETTDLATSMPGRILELRENLARWRQEVGAQMPEPNPNAKKSSRPGNP